MPDFYKYHALGNDYIVIDPRGNRLEMTPDNIKLICHRNFGVGSDGILHGPTNDGSPFGLRIYNPDGSEAEKSGNGVRIFSRYLVDAGYVTGKTFELQTPGGLVSVECLGGEAGLFKVDMGEITFKSELIPVAGEPREVVDEVLPVGGEELKVTCASIGNPHCVVPMDEISEQRARAIGPLIENHERFPHRINVQLLKVLDRNNIRIEIWERGAGYTLASGSSSCAAAASAHRLGLADRDIKVHMPGGNLDIRLEPDGHVFMTGPVSGVARGEFAPDLWRRMGEL